MRCLACSSKTDSKEGAPTLVSVQRAIHGCTSYCISHVLMTSRKFPICWKIALSMEFVIVSSEISAPEHLSEEGHIQSAMHAAIHQC